MHRFTGRDSLGGAIQHVRSCLLAGADAVVGVDFSLSSGNDLVTVLAHGRNNGAGWAALCRAVSALHAAGPGDRPGIAPSDGMRTTRLAEILNAGSAGVTTVLLGPDSDVGHAVARADRAGAAARLAEWTRILPGAVAIEVVCSLALEDGGASIRHAVRMLELAHAVGVPVVLGKAIRQPQAHAPATNEMPPRRVPQASGRMQLGTFQPRPHVGARLASAAEMERLAEVVVERSRLPRETATSLLAQTERLADICRLDPLTDLGWNRPELPSSHELGIEDARFDELCRRSETGLVERYPDAGPDELATLGARLTDELDSLRQRRRARLVLRCVEISDLIRNRGVRGHAAVTGVGSLLEFVLRLSDIDPAPLGLLSEPPPVHDEAPQNEVDFYVDSNRCHDVLQAIVERFGRHRVCLATDGDGEVGISEVGIGEVGIGDEPLHDRIPVFFRDSRIAQSQFTRVELVQLGILVVGILPDRAQGALALAVFDVARVHGSRAALAGGLPADAPYLDATGTIDLASIPLDDEATFEAVRAAHGIGIFEAEVRRRVAAPDVRRFEDLVDDGDGQARTRAIANALTIYHRAWLKTHYPAESIAAGLACELQSIPRQALLAEARRMRVPILGIDATLSSEHYCVERIAAPMAHGVLADPDDVLLGIRVPLSEVPGLSVEAQRRIHANRPYADLSDFAERAGVSPGLLCRLGLAGALDSLVLEPAPRGHVMTEVRNLIARAKRPRARSSQPALSLFEDEALAPMPPPPPRPAPAPTLSPRSASQAPPRPAGESVADHALERYRPLLDELGVIPLGDLGRLGDGAVVVVAGRRTFSRTFTISDDHRAVVVNVDDGFGPLAATFGPEAQQAAGNLLFNARLTVIQGRLRRTGDTGAAEIEASDAWDLLEMWAHWRDARARAQREAS